jgi:hypothetical protein
MSNIIATLVDSKKFNKYSSEGVTYAVPQQEKVEPSEKQTPEYCSQIARNAFGALMRNKNHLPSHYYSYIEILRSYLHSNQDENYYINLLKKNDPQDSSSSSTSTISTRNLEARRESQMKGYEHLSTQIVSSMGPIRQAIQGLFADYDEYAFVNTIDQQSGEAEETAVAEAYAEITLKNFSDQLESMGVPTANDAKFPLDTTLEELEVYREMGGFKAKWAEGLEQLMFYTQKQSDWDQTLKRKLIDDYLALNFLMAREVYDEEKNIVRWEYVDPANATIQYSDDRAFADAEYAGYFTLEKISKLVKKGFDSDELRMLAKTYTGLFDNPTLNDNQFHYPTKVDTDRIMDFRIPVFHYYWIETDVKRRIKIKHQYGEKNINVGINEDVKPLSDNQIKKGVTQEEMRTRIRRTYRCSWVVDSDMVYDYGLYDNQARKSKKHPQLPIKAYKEVLTSHSQLFGSIVENVVPLLDRQQIIWLKYQDALVKAHPGGYMINMRLLQNLEIEGKNINPLEAFEMFWKYGRGIYMDTSVEGRYEGGAVLPITQIPGNYGELLAVLSREAEYIKAQIRDYTGIDPTTVGVAADSQTATEASLVKQGTNNILRPLTEGVFQIKRDLTNYSARSVQLLCRNDKATRETYTNIVGADVVDMLVELERNSVDYGMFFEPKPGAEEVRSLMEAASAALSTGRDGESQIDLDDWMYIQERIMNGGNIKKLRRDLSFTIKKKKQEDHQMKLERERVQAQEQQKITTASAEAQKQSELNKAQAEILLQDKKTKDQILIDTNESNLNIKEMVIEKRLEAEQENMEDANNATRI